MSDPVLKLSDARIVVDDVVCIEQLSLESQGDRVLLVGEVDELFSLLSGVSLSARAHGRAGPSGHDSAAQALPGKARLSRGEAEVCGVPVGSAAYFQKVGAAPLDPPLPRSYTAEQYVTWGARLSGASLRASAELAESALRKVGLFPARRRLLETLSLPERRVLLLAHAVVASPQVVVAEAPLTGLEGASAAFVLSAIAAVSEGRKAILSASRLSPASPEGFLAGGASYLAVIAGGAAVLTGTPGTFLTGASVYGLTVRSNAASFERELVARGIRCSGGPKHFSAVLPEGSTTRDILAAAQAASAALIEILPLI